MVTRIPDNHVRMSAYGVRAATAGECVHLHSETVAEGITSDSRRVASGNVFVALKGETFDGHDHVARAVAAGAHTVVVNRGRGTEFRGANVVEVSDTLRAWGALGRAHLRSWRRGRDDRRVIAITGSSGKTSTKEWLAGLLSARAPTQATQGNLNNLIGVPATCFTVTDEHTYAVIEAGMSIPGEIAALGSYLRPDISIVTNIGLAHVAQFGSRAGIAREKGALFATTREDGTAVFNADDVAVTGELLRARAREAQSFGQSQSATVRLVTRVLGPGGATTLRYEYAHGELVCSALPYIPEAQALNLAAGLTAYHAATREFASAEQVVAVWSSMPKLGRGQVVRAANGTLFIDDTYNANPDSMRSALRSLVEIAAGARTVAVLGEMRELGAMSGAAHATLGVQAHAAGISELVTLGGDAGHTAASAKECGMHTNACETLDAAYTHLSATLRSGDVVLFKASRGVAAERLLERLLERLKEGET